VCNELGHHSHQLRKRLNFLYVYILLRETKECSTFCVSQRGSPSGLYICIYRLHYQHRRREGIDAAFNECSSPREQDRVKAWGRFLFSSSYKNKIALLMQTSAKQYNPPLSDTLPYIVWYVHLYKAVNWYMTWITVQFTWFVQHCKNILIIKPTRCTNFSIYFWNKTVYVSDSSSVHHQEFFTVHTPMLCCTGLLTACEQDQDGTVPSWSRSQAVSKPVQHSIGVCTVKNSWWWTEELSETCRVLFKK